MTNRPYTKFTNSQLGVICLIRKIGARSCRHVVPRVISTPTPFVERLGLGNTTREVKVYRYVDSAECFTDEICHAVVKYSVCHKSKCRCPADLSYSHTTKTCMRCKEYGDTFTAHYGKSIKGHNDMMFNFDNRNDCLARCLAEDFLCKAVEYFFINAKGSFAFMVMSGKPGDCIISKMHYGEVPYEDQTFIIGDWVLLLRNCA